MMSSIQHLYLNTLATALKDTKQFLEPTQFHRQLAHFNHQRLLPSMPSSQWQEQLRIELDVKVMEGHFLEQLRAEVASLVPHILHSNDFVHWFESLLLCGQGQHHPLFNWLATEATQEQMRWFLTQEVAGEAGFEDLLAYTQVKMPVQAKLEFARNYWDEMGRGKIGAMHGPLLTRMVENLDLQPAINTTVWEALALNNTMVGLALSRRYSYQAIGALGVIELTAPSRAEKVSAGMQRLGLDQQTRAYFDLHVAIDVVHARGWINEIVKPLVDENPDCAPFIAEGALMRLLCGKRCFDRYSQELALNFAKETC